MAKQGTDQADVVEVAGPPRNGSRRYVTTGVAVVALLAGVAVGRATLASDRSGGVPERLHERDGVLPVGVPVRLEGWEVSRDSQPLDAECVLVQPRQQPPEVRGGLEGAVVATTFPRRIKPDPAGRLAARVICHDLTDGTELGSVQVRPRTYVATPPAGATPAVLSEVPLDQARLDALGHLVAEARALVGTTVVYVVRNALQYDARADVDDAGDLTMPADLTDNARLAEVVLFHGLVRSAYARWSVGSETAAMPAPRVLTIGTYDPGFRVEPTAADAAATVVTIWRYHRAALNACLARLTRAEQGAARAYVRKAIRALTADNQRRDALEALAPGITTF